MRVLLEELTLRSSSCSCSNGCIQLLSLLAGCGSLKITWQLLGVKMW